MNLNCTVRVPAKINLSLDVVGKRSDGYHLLETIMQSIGIYDTVEVSLNCDKSKEAFPKIILTSTSDRMPTDIRNTAYRAAKLFIEKQGNRIPDIEGTVSRVQVHIDKNIPLAAGLAGGSADASGTLYALNHLFGCPIGSSDLLVMAASIGADVPFCLTGGTALCTGIGDIIEPMAYLGDFAVLLINPGFGVSTPRVFKTLEIDSIKNRPETRALIASISDRAIGSIFKMTANVLEEVTIALYPVIGEIKSAVISMKGCYGAMMSGSGPTVFAIFKSPEDAAEAKKMINADIRWANCRTYLTNSVNTGPYLIETTEGN